MGRYFGYLIKHNRRWKVYRDNDKNNMIPVTDKSADKVFMEKYGPEAEVYDLIKIPVDFTISGQETKLGIDGSPKATKVTYRRDLDTA